MRFEEAPDGDTLWEMERGLWVPRAAGRGDGVRVYPARVSVGRMNRSRRAAAQLCELHPKNGRWTM